MSKITYMSDEQFRNIVSHTGRISLPALKVRKVFDTRFFICLRSRPNPQITQAVLFSSAIFCFIGRLSIRITTRKTLLLDDDILIFSAACLCGATAYFFRYSFLFYLNNATVHDPSLKSTTAFLPYAAALRDNQAPRNIFACFNWTAIYAVKLCFFTFFKPLIRNFRALTIFYWVSVVFTVLAWFAAATSGWFFTLYANRPNAPPGQKGAPNIGFTVSLSLIDIVSDIMSAFSSPYPLPVQSYNWALARGITTNHFYSCQHTYPPPPPR
jgi:hypothetical protein